MRKGQIALGIGIGLIVTTGAFLLLRKFRLSGFKKNLVNNSIKEWKLWGSPVIKGGKIKESGEIECSPIYKERVGEYWNKGVNRNLDGCRDVPWSAAFISFLMKKSGAGNDFPYTSGHSKYIRPFITNRKEGRKAKFKAYTIFEEKPKLGDLVCYSRETGVDYDTTRSYKGHCDIVVDVNKRKRKIEVIGGNVSDGVTKRILTIDKDGYLNDSSNDWFTVIKNYK